MLSATENGPKPRYSWLAYLLTPQVLLGGVLGWGASHLWDYGKELRDKSSKEVSEVRDSIQKYVIPAPKTVATTQEAIDALEKVLALHEDTKAQDLLNRQMADLARLRDKQRAAEESRQLAAEAQAAARAQAEKAEQAKKDAEAEASAKAKAAAEAEAARQLEVSRVAAAAAKAAQDREALQAARAERAQWWFDRAPK